MFAVRNSTLPIQNLGRHHDSCQASRQKNGCGSMNYESGCTPDAQMQEAEKDPLDEGPMQVSWGGSFNAGALKISSIYFMVSLSSYSSS